jgi:hypothetical protein
MNELDPGPRRDLFLADSTCLIGCSGIPLFNPSNSSTFTSSDVPFGIKFGSGHAAGTLAQDVVQMAGFAVSNQTFGVCDRISSGLLTAPVSGLLGLAWQTIASSQATPFWQALVASGSWDSPVMSFQLTRYVHYNLPETPIFSNCLVFSFLDDPSAQTLEPGGTFTMGIPALHLILIILSDATKCTGFVNSSLYTGDIDFVDMPGTPSYWILPLTCTLVRTMLCFAILSLICFISAYGSRKFSIAPKWF